MCAKQVFNDRHTQMNEKATELETKDSNETKNEASFNFLKWFSEEHIEESQNFREQNRPNRHFNEVHNSNTKISKNAIVLSVWQLYLQTLLGFCFKQNFLHTKFHFPAFFPHNSLCIQFVVIFHHYTLEIVGFFLVSTFIL